MSQFVRDQYEAQCNDEKKQCVCGTGGLVLPRRHLSYLISIVLGIVFVVFMIGYFIGQRTAVEQFAVKMAQESLSDRINSSLYTLYEGRTQQDASAGDDGQEEDTSGQTTHAVAKEKESVATKQRYYAQIMGFGNEQAARTFVQRMKEKNIHVLVKPRHSKTARGKQITWYQIVSEIFDSRETVDALVGTIRRQEHISTVRVITC